MTRTREENALDLMHEEYERKLKELQSWDVVKRSYGEEVDDNLTKLDALNHALEVAIQKEHANKHEHKYTPMRKAFMVTSVYRKRGFERCDVFESDSAILARAVFDGMCMYWQEYDSRFFKTADYWIVRMWRKDDRHNRYQVTIGPGGHHVDVRPTEAKLLYMLDQDVHRGTD